MAGQFNADARACAGLFALGQYLCDQSAVRAEFDRVAQPVTEVDDIAHHAGKGIGTRTDLVDAMDLHLVVTHDQLARCAAGARCA